MKSPHYIVCSFLLLAFFALPGGCGYGEQEERVADVHELHDVDRDLAQIRENGTLVLLTENSSVSFYLYRGQGMGYDYELVNAFAKTHGLNVEIRILDDLNAMFDRLRSGDGDLIACNLTRTRERMKDIAFTEPLSRTRQVLVQRRPSGREAEEPINDWFDLIGREVYVHGFSVFQQTIDSLTQKHGGGPTMIEASGNLSSERLIKLVSEGQIDLTIADENTAMLNATYYPNLDISFALTEPQEIAWAVRKGADSLLTALNDWIANPKTARKRNFVYHKYFKAAKNQQARVQSVFSSLEGKRISEFDEAIKRYSKDLRWDWRLLSAMIYHESRFNPEARSWAGAFGLMQLMPRTAERFGIDSTHTREANIKAGVAYLKYLDKYWTPRIKDPEERVNFVLASYNVGPGHVQDAREIARQTGKDPDVWFNNVAEGLLLKSDREFIGLDGVKHGYCRGAEPVNYVTNVRSKFVEYLALDP